MGRTTVLVAALVNAATLAHIGAQSAPLPDRQSFLAEARKRLASNEVLQSRYSYKEQVTEVRFNPFGAIGTGPVEVYEVYPVVPGQLTYRRLIERDGAPVPSAELLLADRQFLARYYQWQRDIAGEGQHTSSGRSHPGESLPLPIPRRQRQLGLPRANRLLQGGPDGSLQRG